MKFNYNGKLVRTSKTHIYTHAIIDMESGKLISCSSSEELARKALASELSSWRTGIENGKRMLKAVEAGKSYYIVKVGRRSFPQKLYSYDTIESVQAWLKNHESRIKDIEENWKIVELEGRE